MQQDLLELHHQDIKTQELLQLIKEYNPDLKVAAVYIPESSLRLAEPSFAIKEDGVYKTYSVKHGFIYRDNPMLDRPELNSLWNVFY